MNRRTVNSVRSVTLGSLRDVITFTGTGLPLITPVAEQFLNTIEQMGQENEVLKAALRVLTEEVMVLLPCHPCLVHSNFLWLVAS